MKKEIKENLLKSLLVTVGQNKICDSLAGINKAFDILERELKQKWVEEIEKMKKEIYNKDEIGKVGTHAIASNQNDGYNQAIEDIIETLNQ